MIRLYRKLKKRLIKKYNSVRVYLVDHVSLAYWLHLLIRRSWRAWYAIIHPVDERIIVFEALDETSDIYTTKYNQYLRILPRKEGEFMVESEFGGTAKQLYEKLLFNEKYKKFKFVWVVRSLKQMKFLKENDRTRIVKLHTKKCLQTCVRARYLINTSDVPGGLKLRKNQVYLNTRGLKFGDDETLEKYLEESIQLEVGVADRWLKRRLRKNEKLFEKLKMCISQVRRLKRKNRRIIKGVRNFFVEGIKRGLVKTEAVFYTILYFIRKFGIAQDDNYKRLLMHKNKHAGERCFLIGNGPSLKVEDLEMLKEAGEYTMACNMIVKIYQETLWRPDYHCMIDALIAKYQCEELVDNLSGQLFTNTSTYELMTHKPKDEQCIRIRNIGKKPYYVKGNMLSYYIPSGSTVMGFMLELAIYMGFSEIYLLGVDCTASNASKGHFMKDYKTDEMKEKDRERIRKRLKMKSITDEEVDEYYFQSSTLTYRIIKEYAQRNNVNIYNATRGGLLEVYDRIVLEDVLKHRIKDVKKNAH